MPMPHLAAGKINPYPTFYTHLEILQISTRFFGFALRGEVDGRHSQTETRDSRVSRRAESATV